MSEWPLISLITPSMNQGRFLEATLQSVFAQDYPCLEYIVVDGGSTDGSQEILRHHSNQITWWVSEPDAGQSDALIKGFSRCTGEVMNWLNSDDLLRPGALFAVARAYRQARADVIVGRDSHFRDDPENPVSHFSPSGYRYPDCLRFWAGDFRYHQPCTFFSRAIYERAGGLDRTLHYAMDYDLYCRMLAQPGCSVHYLADEISAFRLHDDAKTSRAKDGFIRELRHVSRRYWPASWGRKERHCMDRYAAECSLFQGADLLRRRQWSSGMRAVCRAIGYAPVHAAMFAGGRVARRGDLTS